jgi:GR25 family glycosyltransferase involved in LPS biosynthesis
MSISAYMLSCPDRDAVRARTMASLKACDWKQPVRLVIDRATSDRRQDRQEQASFKLLQKAIKDGAEFILFLEDDLDFNVNFRHNLEHWEPLAGTQAGGHFFGSLYNPNVGEQERRPERATMIARPETVYGSQAIVLSRATAAHIVNHWGEVRGMQDIKMSRLAAQVTPLYYHLPSLVQHTGVSSLWGGHFHSARDFQARWKAVPAAGRPVPETVREAISPEKLPREEILGRVRPIEGWLEDDEADLLIRAAARAARFEAAGMLEVGSYCGKSTLAIALTLKALDHPARVFAVDSFNGTVSTPGGGVMHTPPTYEKFNANLRAAGVSQRVTALQCRSAEVEWDRPISLLLIDGLHDAINVAADFQRFARWLVPGGLAAFHDCNEGFPSVRVFVNELFNQGGFRLFEQAGSLAVLDKVEHAIL